VIDTAGPAAVLTGIATLTTDGLVVFTVTFTDASGVSVNSTENALLVTGPNGFSRVASWTTILSSNGSPRVRQYFINASDVDDFREINNGTYTVSLINKVVLDVLGNAATGAVLGTFIVSIDSTPPAAVLSAIPQVTTSGAVDIVVTFSDASGVVASTLPGSILVTGPNGSLQVATLVTTGLGNGSPLVATYRVSPSNRGFNPVTTAPTRSSSGAGLWLTRDRTARLPMRRWEHLRLRSKQPLPQRPLHPSPRATQAPRLIWR